MKKYAVLTVCLAAIFMMVISGCGSTGKKSKRGSSGKAGKGLETQLAVMSDKIIRKLSEETDPVLAVFSFTVSELESVRGLFFAKQFNLALAKANKKMGRPVEVMSYPQLLDKLKRGGFTEYNMAEADKTVSLMKAADCDFTVTGNLTEKQFTYIVDAKVLNWKGMEIARFDTEVFKSDVAAEKVNMFGRAMDKTAHRIIEGYKGFDSHRVAVYEFKENGIRSQLGSQIARELPGYLSDAVENSSFAGQFEILTRTQLDQIVREQRITMGDLFEQDNASFGKLLKASAIISGDITRREGGLYITAQLVDLSGGKILSSATVRLTEESVAASKPRDLIGDISLSSDRDPDSGLPFEILSSKDKAVMVLVPEGLTRGYSILDKKNKKIEKNVGTFYIDKYEVTNVQFSIFLNGTKRLRNESGKAFIDLTKPDTKIYSKRSRFEVRAGFEKYPVVNVSWYGASAYADWAGKRLPEIIEWQKAAAWDPVQHVFRKYPWGSTWDGSKSNHGKDRGADSSDGYADLCEVMKFENGKSFYNALNMAGNVWEWCGNLEKQIEIIDSLGTKVQKVNLKAVVMGGSFRKGGASLTTTSSLLLKPDIINFSIGFRCVKDPE